MDDNDQMEVDNDASDDGHSPEKRIDNKNANKDNEKLSYAGYCTLCFCFDFKVYVPGLSRPLREGEEWVYDPASYRVYENFETTYPCLSFDQIYDRQCDQNPSSPYTCYLVGGTQADRSNKNELYVMKVSNLHSTDIENTSDSEDEEDDDEGNDEKKSKLTIVSLSQHAVVNRIKTTTLGESTVCVVFEEYGKVKIWNLTEELDELYKSDECDGTIAEKKKQKPMFLHSFDHQSGGFALAWSKLQIGSLASGDRQGKIYLWKMHEGGKWVVDERPLLAHKGSVEDIMWSPAEEPLLVSCSTDRTIRLWDTRSAPNDACVCVVENAHESDVNVLSWNRHEPLIVSGGDEGIVKVWSLKTIQTKEPVALFKYHKQPITSIEWSPHDSTTFMVSSEDDQISFWDLALESDTTDDIAGIPPQLLFLHMGQKEIKEVHWNEQIQGLALSTSLSCFNIFQPANISTGQ